MKAGFLLRQGHACWAQSLTRVSWIRVRTCPPSACHADWLFKSSTARRDRVILKEGMSTLLLHRRKAFNHIYCTIGVPYWWWTTNNNVLIIFFFVSVRPEQQNKKHASTACSLVLPESAMQSQEEQVSEHTGKDKELVLSKLLIFKHPQHTLH